MRARLSFLILSTFAAGCAVVSVDGQRMGIRSDEFSAYVEAVFRRQNELAADLILALDTEDVGSERYLQLEDAELELQTACIALNAMALARRDGEEVGGIGALKQARQAPECESSTLRAASVLGSDPFSD
jgi:hypothetical protein